MLDFIAGYCGVWLLGCIVSLAIAIIFTQQRMKAWNETPLSLKDPFGSIEKRHKETTKGVVPGVIAGLLGGVFGLLFIISIVILIVERVAGG